MSNVSPKQIIDKNGKHTTVYSRDDDGSGVNAGRVGAATSTLTPSTSDGGVQYRFESKMPTVDLDTKEVDLRDVVGAFRAYADELRNHMDSVEEEDTVEFTDEDDLASIYDLTEEIRKWDERLSNIDEENYVPLDELDTDEVQDYIDRLDILADGWENVAYNVGDRAVAQEREGGLGRPSPENSFSVWDGKIGGRVSDFIVGGN